MIALLDEGSNFTTVHVVFAAVFMAVGVFMVIQTLRHSLLKSRLAVEEEERRKAARADYWRTMESAVNSLTSLIEEIDEKIDERSTAIKKLSSEAETSIAELSKALESAEIELRRGDALRRGAAEKLGKKASGKVVNMKAAGAALVRRTHRQVYESFDMGHDIAQISRETGLGIGEIELILALRERIERQGS